jgi:hypothetical protein
MKPKVIALIVAAMGIAGPAQAGPRDDVLAGIDRCGSIADDRAWLNCLYGAAQPMRNQLGLPPAPAFQTQLVPATPPLSAARVAPAAQKSEGGFLSFLLGGDPIISRMPLKDYFFDSHGLFTVTLANGQVWQQTSGDQIAHWRGPASHYLVTLNKGATGSVDLVVADEEVIYRVKRLH